MIRFFKKYFKSEKNLFRKSFLLLLATSLVSTAYGYLIGLAIDKTRVESFAFAVVILMFMVYLKIIDLSMEKFI